MQHLLVVGIAPPRPSIWRTSRAPNMSMRYGPHSDRSAGRSLSRKNTPLLVPPRMIIAGMEIISAVNIAESAIGLLPSGFLRCAIDHALFLESAQFAGR